MERKVLITASTYSHICNFHIPYLEAFRAGGWTVHIGCGGGRMEIPYAHRLVHLPFEKKMHSPQNFKAAAMLRRAISTEDYDLVITHTSLAAFFTRLALKGLKKRPRVINVAHGYLFGSVGNSSVKNKILIAAEKMTAKQTDLVLAMNEWDYAAANKYALAPEVRLIPGMGVDFERRCTASADARERLRREWGVAEDAFVLFYAAEFSPRKNQAMLIRAMAQLPENAALVLAGRGELLDECKALAANVGVSGRVVFPGYVSNVADCCAACDAAVSSSRSEGLPFNVMEAMHCGLPVVASKVKGHTDLISDGVNGFLFPCGDETAFAGKVKSLAASPELYRSLGGNARQSSQKYSLNNVLPRVMAQYLGEELKTPETV